MSPEVEHALRARYQDLLVVETEISVPDAWHEITCNMLDNIRQLVADGRCVIEAITLDPVDGSMRTRVRGAQLPSRTLNRIRASALKGRWFSYQTREQLLFRFPAILTSDVSVDIPVSWHIPVREALRTLTAVAALEDNGYRITTISKLDGHLDVHDNRAAIAATSPFLDFADATLAHADDVTTGTLEKVHSASVLPPQM